MQLSEVLPEIFRRFEKVEVLDERLAFRGLESLHVRVHPRSA
jgi:hypothetical protein